MAEFLGIYAFVHDLLINSIHFGRYWYLPGLEDSPYRNRSRLLSVFILLVFVLLEKVDHSSRKSDCDFDHFMMIMLFLGFSGLMTRFGINVANTNHVAGLFAGMAAGYIPIALRPQK